MSRVCKTNVGERHTENGTLLHRVFLSSVTVSVHGRKWLFTRSKDSIYDLCSGTQAVAGNRTRESVCWWEQVCPNSQETHFHCYYNFNKVPLVEVKIKQDVIHEVSAGSPTISPSLEGFSLLPLPRSHTQGVSLPGAGCGTDHMARMFYSYRKADMQPVEPVPAPRAGNETQVANPPPLLHRPMHTSHCCAVVPPSQRFVNSAYSNFIQNKISACKKETPEISSIRGQALVCSVRQYSKLGSPPSYAQLMPPCLNYLNHKLLAASFYFLLSICTGASRPGPRDLSGPPSLAVQIHKPEAVCIWSATSFIDALHTQFFH